MNSRDRILCLFAVLALCEIAIVMCVQGGW